MYADVQSSDIAVDIEIESMRSLNEKVFRKLDGSYEVSIYPDVVHYLENGKYKDIDNTLVETTSKIRNKANNFDVNFPKTLTSSESIKMSKGDYEINWRLINSQTSLFKTSNDLIKDNSKELLSKTNSAIIYENVLPNTDIEYVLSGSKIKENIYVNSYSENMKFIFEYDLKNLTLNKENDTIVFKNNQGDTVFSFSGLYMIDSEYNISENIILSSKQVEKNIYEIIVTPDDEWLKNAVYPVLIDPTIVNPSTQMSLVDTYVLQSSPSTNYNTNSIMKIGGGHGTEARGLMKFNLPTLLNEQVITYAHIELTKTNYKKTNLQVNIFKNTSNFDVTTVSWSNGRPSYNSNEVVDYYGLSSTNREVIFDVTKTVNEWQTGLAPNYGFTLAVDDLTGEQMEVYQFDSNSSYRPIVRIGFENPSGLKDYWTYTSQDVGQVGTGYISDYTGNLTFVRNEYQVDNEYLPLSLNFYFNNATRTTNIGYGNGWKTNYNMKIEYDSPAQRYFMSKPDGGRIYFIETDVYYDDGYDFINCIAEDGSGMMLELVFHYNNYSSTILTTKDHIKYYFNSYGRLTQILNTKNSHRLNISYEGLSERIKYVSDIVGNRIDFIYSLNGSNYLMTKTELKLKQPGTTNYNVIEDKSYYYYTASTNPRLYQVSQRYNKSGQVTPVFVTGDTLVYSFNSSSNRLMYAYNNTSKHRVTYSYDSNSRVNTVKITDLTSGTVNLANIDISYYHGKTRYRNHKNEWIEYLFDNYGHTINALDSYGNSTYYRYAGLFTYSQNFNDSLGDAPIISYYPNYLTVHALLETSETMKQSINYINNHSFENIDHVLRWSKSGSGSISKDTNEQAFGEASLKVNNNGVTYAYQDIFLKAGVYTLQGFVKNTNNLISGSSSISVDTISGTFTQSTSDVDEWESLSVPFEITIDHTVRIKLTNNRYLTSTYFDNISLTEGFIDTRYNSITNSSFEEGTSNWIFSGASIINDNSSTGANQDILGEKSVKIVGDGGSFKYLYQDITSFFTEGETYIIGGWGKANAVPHKAYINENGYPVSDGRFFGIYIAYEYYASEDPYSDTPEVGFIYLPFNTSTEEWQYQMRSFKIDVYQILSVRMYVKYQGEGTAYFDNIQLYHDRLSTKYNYNFDTGYLDSKISKDGVITSYDRDSNGNVTVINEGNKTIEIDYSNNRITEITANNIRTVFTYDSSSKKIKETLIGDNGSNGEWFKTNLTYSSDNQYIASQTDEFGNKTKVETNHLNGLVEKITNANNHLKSYEYNDYGLLKNQVETDISNQYTIVKDFIYDSNRRLSGITIDGISYTFHYDHLDRITNIKIAGVNYVTLTYLNEQYDLTYATNKANTQTYATGDTYTFNYNDEDQIKLIKFNGVDYFEYVYDQSGRLSIYKELQYNNIFFYNYDLAGRIKQIVDKHGNRIKYTYDEQGNINKYSYEVEDVEREVYYFYNENTGEYLYTIYETNNETVKNINHIDTTDSLRRLTHVELLIGNISFTEHFTYKTPIAGSGNASFVVAAIAYKKNGITQQTHYFTYDALGNITEISIKNVYSIEIENYQYKYDGFNRLIRENIKTVNYQETILYTYDDYGDSKLNDNRGNITSIKRYTYTKVTPTGTPLSETRLFYKTSGWKDQVTYIEYYKNGTLEKTANYTYDAIGNLISIISDSNQSFEWEGRRLKEHTKDGITYTYTYNDQGIRTSKSNATDITTYVLDNSLVLFEKTGNDIIYYTYNLDGSLLSMNYLGNEYFYIKNLQGDIIEIVNASGNTVAKYRYDAFGNIVYQWDSGLGVATINPYRYRSYRLDSETGLYYLNARYYDPSIGRFISADSINYLDPSSEQGLNLYAYANNNPVMYIDRDGHSWESFCSGVGNWFQDHWVELAVGATFIVVGSLVTVATAGTGVGFMAAFGSALLTSTTQVGISMAISVGVGGLVSVVNGGGFFDNIGDSLASGFMWGGIFAGGAQLLSGGFKLAAQHGFKGFGSFLSPDRLRGATEISKIAGKGQAIYNTGGRLASFGFGAIDVGTKSLLHMHLWFTTAHIPLGTVSAGIIGGL